MSSKNEKNCNTCQQQIPLAYFTEHIVTCWQSCEQCGTYFNSNRMKIHMKNCRHSRRELEIEFNDFFS